MVLQGKEIKNKGNILAPKRIGLVVDDVCSLPKKIIEENQIEVVETKLIFEEIEKYPKEKIYQIMQKTKAHPKTSAPSPGQFLKAYKKSLLKNDEVLVITLSSKLSGTFNSANQAKRLMPDSSKIEIVDSSSAAAAEGLLAFKAIELVEKEKDIKKIKRELENIKRKIKMIAFLETTYWVEKIGRITKKRAFGFKFLKALGIMPIIGIKKGEVGIVGFNFWTTKNYKAIFHQLKKESKKAKKMDKKLVIGINYTDNKDLAFWLKEMSEKKLKAKVVFVSMVPLIIGANSGPGTLIAAAYVE